MNPPFYEDILGDDENNSLPDFKISNSIDDIDKNPEQKSIWNQWYDAYIDWYWWGKDFDNYIILSYSTITFLCRKIYFSKFSFLKNYSLDDFISDCLYTFLVKIARDKNLYFNSLSEYLSYLNKLFYGIIIDAINSKKKLLYIDDISSDSNNRFEFYHDPTESTNEIEILCQFLDKENFYNFCYSRFSQSNLPDVYFYLLDYFFYPEVYSGGNEFICMKFDLTIDQLTIVKNNFNFFIRLNYMLLNEKIQLQEDLISNKFNYLFLKEIEFTPDGMRTIFPELYSIFGNKLIQLITLLSGNTITFPKLGDLQNIAFRINLYLKIKSNPEKINDICQQLNISPQYVLELISYYDKLLYPK